MAGSLRDPSCRLVVPRQIAVQLRNMRDVDRQALSQIMAVNRSMFDGSSPCSACLL